MFELHCDELIRALSKRAESQRMKLLTKMLQDHQTYNKTLCDAYEEIAEKALTSPSSTEHLMELKSYIAQVENETIFELENKLISTKNRLGFLLDFVAFSPADIRMNNSVFQWHQRMPEVFLEHRKIVNANRMQYENALKMRRERFIEDLDGYSKQIEEFHSFGELHEISRYLKKAQALHSRLEVASNKVLIVKELTVSNEKPIRIFPSLLATTILTHRYITDTIIFRVVLILMFPLHYISQAQFSNWKSYK